MATHISRVGAVPHGIVSACLLLSSLTGSSTAAETITLDAFSRGQLSSTRQVLSAGPTAAYTAGNVGGQVYYNYFIFDMSSIHGAISNARLRLFNPPAGLGSNTTSELYGLWTAHADQNGNLSELDSSGCNSRWYTSGDQGMFAEIALKAKFEMAANDRTGRYVAVWGQIGSLDTNSATPEYVFRYSEGTPASNTQLIVTVAPEPGTTTGLAALVMLLSRRKPQRP